MSFKFIAVLSVFYIFSDVDAQIGQACNMKITGAPGVCRSTADCPAAKEQASKGIPTTICGFVSNLPIVCCEGTQAAAKPPTQDVQPSGSNDDLANPQDKKDEPINIRKCREYSALVTKKFEILPLKIGETISSYDEADCDKDGIPLIIGGSPASLDEFPFMAAIGYRVGGSIGWKCGGTLISDKYVMTAAHCTNTRDFGPAVVVRLGDLNLYDDEDLAHPIDFDIEELINHPSYKSRIKFHDIALIKLRGTVKFSKSIFPACLWNKEDINQVEVQATGWGRLDNGSTSDILMKVGLNLLPEATCKIVYKTMFLDSMICAGVLEENKDTCNGDSGGPLVITKKDNPCVYLVVGVTSFGRICARKIPAVYSRVSSYVPWIEKTVW